MISGRSEAGWALGWISSRRRGQIAGRLIEYRERCLVHTRHGSGHQSREGEFGRGKGLESRVNKPFSFGEAQDAMRRCLIFADRPSRLIESR